MTVELQFQPDPRQAAQALSTDGAALFDETLLLVPIRFAVNGLDVLPIRRLPITAWSVDSSGSATTNEPIEAEAWTEQPLLGFLTRLRHAIDAARQSGRSHVYLAGHRDLVLTALDAERLEVSSPNGSIAVAAPNQEFADALTRFEWAIRAWLQQDAPQLVAHPHWPDWFPSPES